MIRLLMPMLLPLIPPESHTIPDDDDDDKSDEEADDSVVPDDLTFRLIL